MTKKQATQSGKTPNVAKVNPTIATKAATVKRFFVLNGAIPCECREL